MGGHGLFPVLGERHCESCRESTRRVPLGFPWRAFIRLEAARAAAVEEVVFATTLCRHEVNTIIAMHRTLEDGNIKEQFRTLRRREGGHAGADSLHAFARAFQFVDTDEEPADRVDLAGLMRGARS
jgi:hypothetical protein